MGVFQVSWIAQMVPNRAMHPMKINRKWYCYSRYSAQIKDFAMLATLSQNAILEYAVFKLLPFIQNIYTLHHIGM